MTRLVPTLWAALALGSCTAPPPPRPAVAPRKAALEARPSEPRPLPPPPAALGPAEEDVPPLAEVVPQEVRAPLDGPKLLYGSALSAPRPNAPGRTGELLVAIDAPYQVFGRSASYIHVSAWRKDGQPAAGANIYVDRRGVGRTDASGTLVVAYEPKEPGDQGWRQHGIFAVDGAMRCGAVAFQPYGRTKTFATDRLFVYTDRGVFQPGETVHTRVIGWRLKHDYAPLAGAEVEMLLRDQQGHSIAAAAGKTDEFGVTAVDLKVPLTAAMGDYDLRVAYGQERASTRLQIRRFEPPALRMEHTLGRFVLRSHAGALSFSVTLHPPGAETLGAVSLAADAKGPRGKLIARIERKVRGNGPHELRFTEADVQRLIDATKEGELARIEIRARDAIGREVKLARELRVTAQPYVGILELDKDAYATGDPASVVARLSDRDSVPVRGTEVELKVAGRATPLVATTDAAGMARFSLPMPSADTAVELSVRGAKVAEETLTWTAPKPMRTALGSPVVLERRKTTVNVRFPAEYEPVGGHVHMDMTDTSGSIVGARLLPIEKDARGYVARGDLVAPSWGSLLLTFFTLGRPKDNRQEIGLMVSGQSLVVQTDRELEITLEGLPDRARPGDDLSVRARVRTARGEAADVSLGAALVDKSVLSLKDPLEITPMDRFYNPALRTLATTGSQILTWPVVTRNFGNERRYDVALPPWEWLPGGAVSSCREHWDEQDWKASGEKPPMTGGTGHGKGSGAGFGGMGRSGTAVITIRTRFPTTSLWEPHLRGKGSVDIRGRFPDRIGEQELIVVASDKQGGVGLARRTVELSQPVFVEADLLSPLVAGERIHVPAVVHNHTEARASFEVTLRAGAGERAGRVEVPAGGRAAVDLPLKIDRVGRAKIAVRAVGAGHDDRVLRDVTVAPRGIPLTSIQTATARSGTPTRIAVSVARDATAADAHLRIELPAITTAFAQLPKLATALRDDPWSLAGDLTSAALALQLADRMKLDSAQLSELRGRLVAAIALARRVQQKSGGFAYWRNGKPSAFVTARVLAGLLEARRAGLPVPSEPIESAARFVAKDLASGELAKVSDIAWWEGDTKRVREGITAELFAVLSRLPEAARQGDIDTALGKLTTRFQTYLRGGQVDSLTAGHALTALLRLKAIDAGETSRVIGVLLAQRDEGHWEPSWFHAFGGRVDATLAVLEALALAYPRGREADKRDALAWLLSTRDSWGDWHSEAATAAALRAMHLAGAAPEEIASTIAVRLDGKPVAKIAVDPADPYKSTTDLAHLDLGPLTPGIHTVEVDYGGKLTPALTLVSRQWTTGRAATDSRDGAELRTRAPSAARAGTRFDVAVSIAGKRTAGGTLYIGRSGLLELDLGALGTMIGRGRPIADVVATDSDLALTIGPDAGDIAIALPFIAVRRGHGHLPTIGFAPRGANRPLIADPGVIRVR